MDVNEFDIIHPGYRIIDTRLNQLARPKGTCHTQWVSLMFLGHPSLGGHCRTSARAEKMEQNERSNKNPAGCQWYALCGIGCPRYVLAFVADHALSAFSRHLLRS